MLATLQECSTINESWERSVFLLLLLLFFASLNSCAAARREQVKRNNSSKTIVENNNNNRRSLNDLFECHLNYFVFYSSRFSFNHLLVCCNLCALHCSNFFNLVAFQLMVCPVCRVRQTTLDGFKFSSQQVATAAKNETEFPPIPPRPLHHGLRPLFRNASYLALNQCFSSSIFACHKWCAGIVSVSGDRCIIYHKHNRRTHHMTWDWFFAFEMCSRSIATNGEDKRNQRQTANPHKTKYGSARKLLEMIASNVKTSNGCVNSLYAPRCLPSPFSISIEVREVRVHFNRLNETKANKCATIWNAACPSLNILNKQQHLL